MRLESFLFTEEAFESVAEHLTDDGIFVLYNYYREPWLVAKIADDARGRVRGHAAAAADLRQRHGDHRGRPARGQPRRRAATGRPVRRHPRRWATPTPQAGHGRLAVPVPPDRLRGAYYLVALAIILLGALIAVAVAAARHGHQLPALQPPLLRAGHRVPAARDPQPGQLQPAVRHDLAGQRAGLLRRARERAGGHLHQLASSRSVGRTCCT